MLPLTLANLQRVTKIVYHPTEKTIQLIATEDGGGEVAINLSSLPNEHPDRKFSLSNDRHITLLLQHLFEAITNNRFERMRNPVSSQVEVWEREKA